MKAEIGKRYRHYKGGEYLVLSIARHTETLDELVVYEAQYDSPQFGNRAVWARPREMFEGSVKLQDKYVDRFTSIS